MADTVDSLSIELTASTGSAEASIQRVIDMLRMLKAATIDASIESKIGKSIRSIAQAAKEIDSDAGQKLARLAGGLRELSKVGDLSNLANAGKNLSGVVRAVNSMGHGGNGLSNLANGIRGVSDALGGIKDADVSKLNAVKDALSGEMSGSLHSSTRTSESAALGGMGSPEPSFGNMAVYGAMTVFKYTADSIRDATAAYHEFQAALGSSIPPIFTEFVNGAKEATRSVLMLGNAIRGLLTEGQNFSFSGAGDTFFKRRMAPLLNAGQDFTFGNNGVDKSAAIEIEDLGESASETADKLRDVANSTDEVSGKIHDATGDAVRFHDILGNDVTPPNSWADADMRIRKTAEAFQEAGNACDDVSGKIHDVAGNANRAAEGIENVANSTRDATSASISFGDRLRLLFTTTEQFRKGIAGFGTALLSIPKYFGGQLVGNIEKAGKSVAGFFRQIKRVAMYRLIRTAIREITQGISEGTKHLYNWSKAANGEFAASMNQIATASQYLGNSFAAMVSPLIEVLSPAIDFIVGKVVDMFNIINQIFARLSGKTSYTAAKKVAAQWDDASKKASGSAKKAADEIKRTILGFDEINKLNDANTRSGGGGGGAGAGDTGAGMFETRMIEGEVSNFADSLRAAFEAGNWSDLGTLLGDKVNEIVDSIDFAGAGQKVGYAINGLFTTKYWTLDTINFTNIGSNIAEFLNNAIGQIDFGIIGRGLVQKMTIIGDLAIGFFTDFDWGQAATALSDFTKGLFDELTKWINKTDWKETFKGIVDGLGTFINNIDYDGIADSFAGLLESAINAVRAIAVDMIIQPTLTGFTDIVEDIQNGNGVNWENLGEWLKDAAFMTGLFFAATGNFKAGLVALGIGLVIEPIINKITDIVKDIRENGLSKNTVIDIIEDLLKAIGVGMSIIGVMTGNPAVAGIGILAVGLSLAVRPAINKITDIVKDIKENGLSKNTVIDIVEGLLKAIGAGMFIIGVMTGNPAIAGIGILAVGLSLAVRPAINKITDIVKDIRENGLTKNTVIDIIEGLLKAIGVGMFMIGTMTGNPVVAGIGILAFGLSIAVRPTINKITDFVENIQENGLSDDTLLTILGAAIAAIGGIMLGAGVLTGNPFAIVSGALVLTMGIALKPVIATVLDIGDNIGDNGITWETLEDIIGNVFTGLGTALLFVNPGVGAVVLGIGLTLKFKVVSALVDLGEGTKEDLVNQFVKTGEIPTVFDAFGYFWNRLFPGASAEESNAMQVAIEFSGVPGNGFKSVGETIDLNDLHVSPVTVNGTNGTGINSLGTTNTLNNFNAKSATINGSAGTGISTMGGTNALNGFSNSTVKMNATNGTGLQFCGAHNQLNPFDASSVTVNSTPGTGLQLSGTNSYTLKGLKDTGVTVTVDAEGGSATYIGSDDKIHVQTSNASATIKSKIEAGVGLKLENNGLHLTSIPGVDVSVGAATKWATTIGGLIAYLGITDPTTTITAKSKAGWNGSFKDSVGAGNTSSTIKAKSKAGWKETFKSSVEADDTTSTIKAIATKNWTGTFNSAVGAQNSTVTITAKLAVDKANNKVTLQKILDGSVTKYILGKDVRDVGHAIGGAFYGGSWHNIPQYASGTTNAHGSLFLAGEAGPEIVGHVGGRTEVLNKSQLASAMFSAVRSAMSGISIDASFYGGGNAEGEMDGETFAEMMAYMRADSDEMRKQNELLRQQNELLRQIREKDYSPEISTSSINKAQTRANRRAGITIVPVGT